MKKLITLTILLISFILLVACGTSSGENSAKNEASKNEASANEASDAESSKEEGSAAKESSAEESEKPKTLRVLMIGNSFSYYNDMNATYGIFYKIAKSAGYELKIKSIYKGGYFLNQFLDPNDIYGEQVLTTLKSNVKYDIVIIQEYSSHPIAKPKDFYDCCKQFKELVDANGGELWLYQTWGYKEGYDKLKSYGPTTDQMEMKLRAAYCEAGKKLGIKVAYAGAAMNLANNRYPQFDVFHTDLKHPSLIGSTLIAYTLAGTIFDVDSATIQENMQLSAEQAAAMKECASEIYRNGAPVDPAYAVTYNY